MASVIVDLSRMLADNEPRDGLERMNQTEKHFPLVQKGIRWKWIVQSNLNSDYHFEGCLINDSRDLFLILEVIGHIRLVHIVRLLFIIRCHLAKTATLRGRASSEAAKHKNKLVIVFCFHWQ